VLHKAEVKCAIQIKVLHYPMNGSGRTYLCDF